MKRKILYVITQAEMGGAQRYLHDLATSPEAANYNVSIAVGKSQDKSLIRLLNSKNLPVYELKHLVRQISPINDWLAIWELRKLYQKIKPDIIHLNSTKAGVIGSLANHALTKISYKVIYTAHGWIFNEPMSRVKKLLYWGLEKITARPKDKIICVSEFDREIALKYKIVRSKKLVTIYNGVNANSMIFLSQEDARRKLFRDFSPTPPSPPSGSGGKITIPPSGSGGKITSPLSGSGGKITSPLSGSGGKITIPPSDSGGKIIIGTVANFYKTKGLEYLIEAIKLLVTSYQLPVTLIIIGDGELRGQLEELIKQYNLKDRVILAGKYAKASQYLKAFDVYACSSVKEGFPYSILEAMAAELPIIATKVGGIPEMIKDNHNGLLVEPKNPGNLAEKIKALINDQGLNQRLAQQAEQDVKNNFTKEQMIKKTFGLYL